LSIHPQSLPIWTTKAASSELNRRCDGFCTVLSILICQFIIDDVWSLFIRQYIGLLKEVCVVSWQFFRIS
jgi:hypothetical protein